MRNIIKNHCKKILKFFNFKLSYYDTQVPRYLKIMDAYKINRVLDIGANEGQFALSVLQHNFNLKIISFEPTRDAYSKLKKISKNYSNWLVYERVAIGSRHDTIIINVSGNSALSYSILDMKYTHIESAHSSKYVSKEDVKLITLDSVFGDLVTARDEVLVKIDVQGYEDQVLIGAINSIKKVRAVKLECSLVSLYEGDKTYEFYFDWLKKLGFVLFDLEPVFAHPTTGRLLQFDATFIRE